MSWIAVAIAGGAIIGGISSNSAAGRQSRAARRSADLQETMWQRTRADLMPWQQSGNLALRELMTRMGIRGTPGTPGAPPNAIGPGGRPIWTQGNMGGTEAIPGGDPNDPNFGQLTHEFNLQDFQASPSYQFNLEQGKQALDKAAAARGRFYAPSTLQDIAKFSQGLASNEYQNAFSNYQTNMQNIWNRLSNLSGAGQNAAAQMGGFGMDAAANQGNFLTQGANAQAAGIMGMSNALTGGLNNWANYNMYQNALAQNQGSSVGTGSAGFPTSGYDYGQNF